MAWGAESVEAGHSQGDGASGSMSVNLDQVVAAFGNSASHWEGATQKLLQFCVETGKRAKETNSDLETARKEIQVLKQLIEENIASLNAYRAQQIGQEDYIGQLEQQLTDLKQRDRDRTQELQEVATKQDLDQIFIQENKARINQLEQLVQPVTVTYSLLEGYLPSAAGVPEDQQASNGLRNQAATEAYPESQQVGTGDPINSEGLEPQLDSSAETLLRVPKITDTSF